MLVINVNEEDKKISNIDINLIVILNEIYTEGRKKKEEEGRRDNGVNGVKKSELTISNNNYISWFGKDKLGI